MKLKELKNGWENNGQVIPNNENNTDYQAIKKYIADGGEYEKFDWLADAKAQKINELNEFHNSDETRELTVKSGNRQTHINMKNDRALIDEQISNMECRIKLGEANPIWVYKNQIEVPLNYKALALIKLKIAEIVDFNFNVRRNSLFFLNAIVPSKEKSIEKCIEEVKNFNFKKDYKINNSFELTL